MDENDAYKLDDYRHEGGSDLVRCAKCGAMINAYAIRCRECGIHFRGEAYDFAPLTGPRRPRAIRWIAGVVVALLVVLATAGLVLVCKG